MNKRAAGCKARPVHLDMNKVDKECGHDRHL